jgi:addiction module HigA family antidote
MSSTIVNEYIPSTGSLPGEILQEALEERQMTQAQLAERMGRPKKTINEIIKGKAAITPETALQLEKVLGISASFWNSLESAYRESLARSDERERLSQYLPWLKNLPIRFMIDHHWIKDCEDKVDLLREALSFFQIASLEQWPQVRPQGLFRLSAKFEVDEFALAAWLQKGKIEASKIRCKPYSEEKFRDILNEIRQVTLDPDPSNFLPRIRQLCSEAGVAFVLVRATPKSRVSGVARWLSKDQALIQLSARGLKDDQLWFTFFHEAAHILLHEKDKVFLEGRDHIGKEEDEANRFSADFLIPPKEFVRISEGPFNARVIREFAHSIGITPSIVLGRLQREKKIGYGGPLESLRVVYQWDE